MEIDKKLRLLAVKVNCRGVRGSGVLIQPETNEYTYVLTARHCIEGSGDELQEYELTDIIVKRSLANGEEIQLVGEECYFHQNPAIDLAIIKIPYQLETVPVYITDAVYKDKCSIYGYPEILKGLSNEREIVYGEISDNASIDGKIEVKVEAKQETTGQRTSVTIKGFSGSGIFGTQDKEIINLYGVFVELKDTHSVYNTYCGFNSRCIKEIVESNNIASLTHYKLTSFSGFLEAAMKGYRKEIATVLNMKFKKEITITPKDIIQQLGDRLAIPYDEECILVDKLWEEWIVLIVLLHIIGVDISNMSYMYYQVEDEKNHIRMLYSGCNRSEDLISEIFTNKEMFETIVENSIIIMNTKSSFRGKMLNREKVKRIVASIDSCAMYTNGIDISDPNSDKNLAIVHMDKFGDSLDENIAYGMKCQLVEDEIKKIVIEVLDDAVKKL